MRSAFMRRSGPEGRGPALCDGRALGDAVRGNGGTAAPVAEHFDPPGETSFGVRSGLFRRRGRVGGALQHEVVRPGVFARFAAHEIDGGAELVDRDVTVAL